jgi:hypothetical protein
MRTPPPRGGRESVIGRLLSFLPGPFRYRAGRLWQVRWLASRLRAGDIGEQIDDEPGDRQRHLDLLRETPFVNLYTHTVLGE